MVQNIESLFVKLSSNEWFEYLEQFDDASIYQTMEFAQFSIGGKNIEHFILKIDGKVTAVSLVRIIKIPLTNRGIAYIRWGPLYTKKGELPNNDNLNIALKSLYLEYVEKRKFILRISSRLVDNDEKQYLRIFQENGYELMKSNLKTVLLNIESEESTLRAKFSKHWRHHLNNVEKLNLVVTQNESTISFESFFCIYKEMLEKKKFKEQINVKSFGNINSLLPKHNKMQIFICTLNNEPVSGLIISHMGNCGIALLAATNKTGRDISASYLLWWKSIKWLKKNGIKQFDLGGTDPLNVPGIHQFKTGTGGTVVDYLGCFEAGKYIFLNTFFRFLDLFKVRFLLLKY